MRSDTAILFLLTVVAVLAIFQILLSAMALPDVHVSYSSGECVEVLNYVEGENYSCENMPEKFNHVWVK